MKPQTTQCTSEALKGGFIMTYIYIYVYIKRFIFLYTCINIHVLSDIPGDTCICKNRIHINEQLNKCVKCFDQFSILIKGKIEYSLVDFEETQVSFSRRYPFLQQK